MSQKGTGYFLFCGRCGPPRKKGQSPLTTLRIRFVRVDTEGVLYLNCICEICLGFV